MTKENAVEIIKLKRISQHMKYQVILEQVTEEMELRCQLQTQLGNLKLLKDQHHHSGNHLA